MDPLYEEFGFRVREARSVEGVSQGELARRVGLSRTSVTNIERGRQHVSLRQFLEIAAALNCAPETLLPQQARSQAVSGELRAAIRRKGYSEEVAGLIEHVWATTPANIPTDAEEEGQRS